MAVRRFSHIAIRVSDLARDGTQIELQQLSLPDTEEQAGFNRPRASSSAGARRGVPRWVAQEGLGEETLPPDFATRVAADSAAVSPSSRAYEGASLEAFELTTIR